jgi:hypothetical protein
MNVKQHYKIWFYCLMGMSLLWTALPTSAQENPAEAPNAEAAEAEEEDNSRDDLFNEVYSNGYGGGRWSDPQTWYDQKVPGPNDIVVISRGDTVTVDMPMSTNRDNLHCRRLYIDPRGVLEFRPGARVPLVLRIGGRLDIGGSLQMVANHPHDQFLLQLAGEDSKDQRIHVGEYSSIVAIGHPSLEGGRKNVRILAEPISLTRDLIKGLDDEERTKRFAATPRIGIRVDRHVVIDVQSAELTNLFFDVNELDSSGTIATQRFYIKNSILNRGSSVKMMAVNSAELVGNRFENDLGSRSGHAINMHGCRNVLIQGNLIRGFITAVDSTHCSTWQLLENRFEDCNTGWNGAFGRDILAQGNVMVNLTVGYSLHDITASIDGGWAESTRLPISISGGIGGWKLGDFQVSNFADVGYLRQKRDAEAKIKEFSKSMEVLDGKDKHPDYAGLSSQLEQAKKKLEEAEKADDGRYTVRLLDRVPLTLMNTPITPEKIQNLKERPRDGFPNEVSPNNSVQAVYYLVVGTDKKSLPAGAYVEVVTIDPDPDLQEGAVDLNIRNNFATFLPVAVTYPPVSGMAITLNSWAIQKGELIEAPLYEVRIMLPSSKEGEPAKLLGKASIRPDVSLFIGNQSSLRPNLVIPVNL